LSNPKAAARAFAAAVHDGHKELAHQCVTGDEQQMKVVDLLVGIFNARQRITDAAVGKWGEEGRSIVQPMQQWDLKNIDEAQESVDGDAATLTPREGAGRAIKLKKIADQWKVDLTSLQPRPEDLQTLSILNRVMEEVAGEIKDGKYASMADARKAMVMKFRDAKLASSTSKPATGE
jgi:hypothetical protein